MLISRTRSCRISTVSTITLRFRSVLGHGLHVWEHHKVWAPFELQSTSWIEGHVNRGHRILYRAPGIALWPLLHSLYGIHVL